VSWVGAARGSATAAFVPVVRPADEVAALAAGKCAAFMGVARVPAFGARTGATADARAAGAAAGRCAAFRGVVRVPACGALAGATGAARTGAAGAFAVLIAAGRAPAEGALAGAAGTTRTGGMTTASIGMVRAPTCGALAAPARAAAGA
jgi:hypothetical protein